MDVLSDILDALKLKGTLYFTTSFTPPWGVLVPAFGRVARFHLLVRGSLWVSVAGQKGVEKLEPGDLVLVPHGAEHLLSDDPKTPCVTVDQVIEESGFTGEGSLIHGGEDDNHPTRMVCGHFAFSEGVDHPLIDRLPPSIIIRNEELGDRSRLDSVLRFITKEAMTNLPGSHAVIQRLSEVFFIQALRLWANRSEHKEGLLAALADPRLSKGLAMIHGNPAEPWTLERLCKSAAVSRTVFSETFRRVVGMSPMQYVAFWRMQKARQMLVGTELTLDAVAEHVGYQSASALTRVFKQHVGELPGSYRKRNRRAET